MKGNANLCLLLFFFLIQSSFYQYLFSFLGKLYILIPDFFCCSLVVFKRHMYASHNIKKKFFYIILVLEKESSNFVAIGVTLLGSLLAKTGREFMTLQKFQGKETRRA